MLPRHRIRPPAVLALALACLCGPVHAFDAPGVVWPQAGARATISQPFGGSTIAVGVSSRTAGAIDSVTWGGTQFINAYDHGRELQSASSYDGYGECLNPTEAGSDADGTGARSSSLLMALQVGPATLLTRSQMAYFMAPGRPVGQCPLGPGPYATARSDDILTKRITLGAEGVANAIAYTATFTTARAHAVATFEAATAYMPASFGRFFTYDPDAGQLSGLSAGPGEQNLPIILSNADGSRAMGVFSPSLPQPSVPGAGYGRFDFSFLPGAGNATVKWNCVYRENNIPPGDYTYTCYVLVGTLQDVQAGIAALRRTLTGQAPAPQAPASPAASVPVAAAAPGVTLYVGTQPGCNAGVVTVDPRYRSCATAAIGSTLAQQTSPANIPVYASTAAGPDVGQLTNNPRHRNANATPVGFLAAAGSGGTQLYVGTQPNCNAGVISTNPAHLNCSGATLGATAP